MVHAHCMSVLQRVAPLLKINPEKTSTSPVNQTDYAVGTFLFPSIVCDLLFSQDGDIFCVFRQNVHVQNQFFWPLK